MRKLFLLLTAAVMLSGTACVVGIMPPPRAEVIMERPYPGAVWVPGHWYRHWWGGHWVWAHGYWRGRRY
jgi:hypothetical protein